MKSLFQHLEGLNAMTPDHLFLASDGNLYDCRVANWGRLAPLRAGYCGTRRNIETVADLKATLRAGEFAWPGGYQMFLLTSDGETLSFDAAREQFRQIASSIASHSRDGWRVVACEINYEDSDMVCAHTGKPIPAAYA